MNPKKGCYVLICFVYIWCDKSGFNYGLLVYNVACGAPNASDYDRLWLGVYEESSQKD